MKSPARKEEKRKAEKEDNIAISTSWNFAPHKSGKSVLKEISELGFKSAELNFSLNPKTVQEIALDKKSNSGIEIISLHNFCPIPKGIPEIFALPDFYSLCSLDEKERTKAIKYTKKTIDTAYLLNAKAIVIHCGRVNMRDYTKALIKLYNEGKKDTKIYLQLKDKMLKERQEKVSFYLPQLLKSLAELLGYARKKDIILGIENRFYYPELPQCDEMNLILKALSNTHIGYWHDTGHAFINEKLGFFKQTDYLNNYRNFLVGLHLHDVKKMKDHNAPNTGEFDFSLLRPFVNHKTIKVIEAHPPATAEEIRESKSYLEDLFKDD